MACNFFNASTGKSIRMVNRNFLQGGIQPGGLYEPIEWYYYQVILKIDENPVEPIPRYNYTVRGFNLNVMSVNIATGLNVGPQRGVGDNLNNPGQPIKFFQSHLT